MDDIVAGRSMATSSNVNKFYSSAIVGGIIPVALGTAMALKKNNSDNKVWCFLGDMTYQKMLYIIGMRMDIHTTALDLGLIFRGYNEI